MNAVLEFFRAVGEFIETVGEKPAEWLTTAGRWIVRARRTTGFVIGLVLASIMGALAYTAARWGDPSSVPVAVWVLAVPAYARGLQSALNDALLEPARTKFTRWAGMVPDVQPPRLSKLAYLAGCPWCLSVWVAAALTCLMLTAPPAVSLFVFGVLGFSELSVIFDRLVDRVTPDPPPTPEPSDVPPDVGTLFRMRDDFEIEES